MKDVQSEKDERGVAIKKVGISNHIMPFTLKDLTKEFQTTVGMWDMYVMLKKDSRGTHMSRFIEVLQQYQGTCLSLEILDRKMKESLKKELNAQKAHIEVGFPYFIKMTTPVTEKTCMLAVHGKFTVSDFHKPMLEVSTPVTTLCPCSKEISKYGAHNQRSFIKIQCISNQWVWIEDLVLVAQNSCSCPIIPLLKRPDEKFVTEQAYNNPMFVEDVAREVALKMREMDVKWYKVTVTNEESIHAHNAYAEVEEKVTLKPWQKAQKDPRQTKVD